ncbi:hypothetical protein AB0G04_22665 [Actinoplanes sp. NPDC023801]|uniref:hypothetical protein n=1 Tax=Actinoplanes sp. NPDC023801 TaxID=3154595 RepID=UPI003401DA64
MIGLTVHEVDFAVPAAVRSLPWYDGRAENFDASDLRYSHFPARVTFSVDDVVVMGPRFLVPLFDLLWCVREVLADLRGRRPASIGFTESADQVRFLPSAGDCVEIIYAESRSRPGEQYFHEARRARADRRELIEALTDFLASGIRTLTVNVAGLDRNEHFRDLAAPS